MIRHLIDREGRKHSKAEAIADPFSIGFTPGYVRAVVDREREWTGAAHVTDITGCPRQSALKYTRPYDVYLDAYSDLLIGEAMHANLETSNSNIRMNYANLITGEADEITPYRDGFAIIDYKVVKSFHVKKALGIVSVDTEILDKYGNKTYFKSGKRAGQIKTKKKPELHPEMADLYTHTRQLNAYKALWDHGEVIYPHGERDYGNINSLIIFFLLKDGGGDAAKNLIAYKTYPVDIEIIEAEKFWEEIIITASLIKEYVEGRSVELPPFPDMRAIWQGRMCQNFCPVKELCNPHFI